jgi:hypothetical protein
MEVDNLFLLDFQVFEVAPSLHMVELRKIGGDTLEFHKVRQHSNLDISKKKKKISFCFGCIRFRRMEEFQCAKFVVG